MIINTDKYTVELIEKDLVTVELKSIDIIHNVTQFVESLSNYLILNEVPTKVSAKIFRTDNDYIADSLVVYFNGIKEKQINKLSNDTFSFNIDTIAGDIIEIEYIKQP